MLSEIFGPQTLNEGISDTVYYMTDAPKEVFSSNALLGTRAYSEHNDHYRRTISPPYKDSGWFLSVARGLDSGYIADTFKGADRPGNVVLELDGGRISHHYSAMPFDYWQGSKTSEREGRVWLPERSLKDLHKYLKRIVLILPVLEGRPLVYRDSRGSGPASFTEVGMYNDTLRLAVEYGKTQGVPVSVILREEKSPLTTTHLRKSATEAEIRELLSNEGEHKEGSRSFYDLQRMKKVAEWWGRVHSGDSQSIMAIFLHYYYLGWITPAMSYALPVGGGYVNVSAVTAARDLGLYNHFTTKASFEVPNGLIDEFIKVAMATGMKKHIREHDSISRAISEWVVKFLEPIAEKQSEVVDEDEPDWPAVEAKFDPVFQAEIEQAREILEGEDA